MFASMFKSLFSKSKLNPTIKNNKAESKIVEITSQDVEEMLTELNEIKNNSNNDNDGDCSTSKNVIEAIDLLSIADTNSEFSYDNNLEDHFDDTTSEVSSIGEINQESAKVAEDEAAIKIVNQINNLLCPFTWNLKPNRNKNVIFSIQNKLGEYNLNISSPEFTFERYIGNLIISFELFNKNETELAQMKILEIGKWLEELDNGTDEFYLSINTGLQYVMKATFIHMLFATNLIGECRWLLDDIESFANMNSQSKATVYAIRAAVLTEYGGNIKYFKKACECAKKACEIDPNTSHWFYIYSLALTAQRHHLYTYKSCPSENEINAIQQAIMLSDGKNTFYNYHRMTLDRDIAIRNYHQNNNKNDKVMIEKNLQDNKIIVQMIKTIISMEPKDPLIVVKCAKTLMTLPIKVRDFNLGKQYLTKAFQMAPNDVTVLKAIEKTVENYKEMSKRNRKPRSVEIKQNQRPLMYKTSKLGGDLRNIVNKHNNGEDAVPYLNVLVANYNGQDKWKITAQICSYTILFKNNLRAGVEQFIPLIEQPGMPSDNLITKHYSSFGSKIFNLAELICNEIRLATNSSNTSSEDMLFYYKMLTKIMETCNVKVKEVDSTMKEKLIVNLPTKSTTYQSDTELSLDNESLIDKNKKKVPKFPPNNYRPKRLQNTGPNVFTKRLESNKRENKTDFNFNSGSLTNTQSKANWTNNTSGIDQMKLKMSKFVNSNNASSNDQFGFTNNTNSVGLDNLRNLQTQSEINHYTQQLYQHILSDSQQQNNSQNVSFDGFNRYHNQNHSYMNSSTQQFSSQNPHPPSLLSLRPTWKPAKTFYSKKK